MGLLRCIRRRLRSRLFLLVLFGVVVVMMIRSLDIGGRGDDQNVFMRQADEPPHKESHDNIEPEEQDVLVEPDDDISPDKKAVVRSLLSTYDIPCDPATLSVTEAWRLAKSWTTHRSIHPEHAPEMGCILHHMATAKIIKADVGYKGTQNKLSLVLEGDQRVSFKPKWYPRDYIVTGEPYAGRDRHNAEMVSFFLNRLLGYNRVPLAVGRVVSLKNDIIPVATQQLKDTFFKQDNNTCFLGKCLYCTGKEEAACGEGDIMEGAVILFLDEKWTYKKWRSPWQRTYKEGVLAKWEQDPGYCQLVVEHPVYNTGPRLLDLLDAVVMDYLIGNADRHHYETFAGHNDSMLVMFDNAKSFGNPSHDEASILVPIQQCCRIREVTYKRLQELSGGLLSSVLRQLCRHDPTAPLLTPPHYKALDRRLKHIFNAIDNCIITYSPDRVLLRDKYSLHVVH